MSLIKGIESTCELSQLERLSKKSKKYICNMSLIKGIESSLGLVNLIVNHLNL